MIAGYEAVEMASMMPFLPLVNATYFDRDISP